MGRMRRPSKAGQNIVASGHRMQNVGTVDYTKSAKLTGQEVRGLQRAAWEFYETIGEFRYACDWVGAMISKAVLYAVEDNDPHGPDPRDKGLAAQYVQRLFHDTEGRAEMLRLLGVHFTVAAECYLVGTVKDGADDWQIYAADQVTHDGRAYFHAGDEITSEQGQPLIIRLWKPHPRKPHLAFSPAFAVLGVLTEIRKMNQHVQAQLDSRLAGAGVFLVPSEIEFARPADEIGEDGKTKTVHVSDADALRQVIGAAMATAIQDRGSASALVPIIITAPAEAIAAARHMTFWSDLDEKAIQMREDALRRLAIGMDMPAEVLLGNGDASHWVAWQADESGIKAHTEPLLRIITQSLTQGYLRPLLDGDPDFTKDPWTFSVKADTSEMRLRPNRSKEALELHDRGELSGAAVIRETGFAESDRMDDKERAIWLTRKVAQGSTTPDLVAAALLALGVEVPAALTAPAGETQEARPTPSLIEHPDYTPPSAEEGVGRSNRRRERIREGEISSDGVPAGLVAACDQIALRALERAGNRMRTKSGGKVEGVPAYEHHIAFQVKRPDLDFYVADAISPTTGDVARRHGLQPEALTASIDSYVRAIITSQSQHSYDRMEAWLSVSTARTS